MKSGLLKGFGFIGVLIFLPLFLSTFLNPHLIEKSARYFIEWRLNKDVNKKIDSIHIHRLFKDKAVKLYKDTDKKLAFFKKELKANLPKIVAKEVAKVSNLSCECRKKWEGRLHDFFKFKIASLKKSKERLANFIQAKYMEIVKKLIFDIRVFLGTNSVVFLLLLIVSFLKPKATKHLFLPAVLLFISTLISSYLYLFEQNWFYTIVYSDYTGFWYIGYLSIIFAIFIDIIFNRARVVTEILNIFFNAIGSAFSLSPC